MTYANCEIIRLIDCHIHNERNRRMLKRRLCDGVKLERLAEEFDLSRSQICNIIREGKRVLLPLLEAERERNQAGGAS